MRVRHPIFFTLLLCIIHVAMPLPIEATEGYVPILDQVIYDHIVDEIETMDPYLPVQLPIKSGTSLLNPVAMASDSHSFLYIALSSGRIVRLQDSNSDGLEDHAQLIATLKPKHPLRRQTMAFVNNKLYLAMDSRIGVVHFKNGNAEAASFRPLDFLKTENVTKRFFSHIQNCGPSGLLALQHLSQSNTPQKISLVYIDLKSKKLVPLSRVPLSAPYTFISSPRPPLPTIPIAWHNSKEKALRLLTTTCTEHTNPAMHRSFFALQEKEHCLALAQKPYRTDYFGGTAGHLFVALTTQQNNRNKTHIAHMPIPDKANKSAPEKVTPLRQIVAGIPDFLAMQFSNKGQLEILCQAPSTSKKATPGLGSVYRIYYLPEEFPPIKVSEEEMKGDLNGGRKQFNAVGCAVCHSIGKSVEKLGPDLLHVGSRLNTQGILTSIFHPSQIIKAGFEPQIVETKDGKFYIGRLVTTEKERKTGITLLVGNAQKPAKRIFISKKNLKRIRESHVSLMPTELVSHLKPNEITDLATYLTFLKYTPTVSIFINSGGAAFEDRMEKKWKADRSFMKSDKNGQGFVSGRAILTAKPARWLSKLGHSARLDPQGYRFKLAPDTYRVSLFFREHKFKAIGKRIFSIIANGHVLCKSLDIYQESPRGELVKLTYKIDIYRGHLNLYFKAIKDLPVISGLIIESEKNTAGMAIKAASGDR